MDVVVTPAAQQRQVRQTVRIGTLTAGEVMNVRPSLPAQLAAAALTLPHLTASLGVATVTQATALRHRVDRSALHPTAPRSGPYTPTSASARTAFATVCNADSWVLRDRVASSAV